MKAIAEAPSKAIITGEHFVVHGALALAAALPRGVRAEVRPSSGLHVRSDRFADPLSGELRPASQVVEEMAREFSVSPAVEVSIESAIPEGAGLGSSASTMVAVASAFARLNSVALRPDDLVRFAMVGERSIHGRPSGVDPAISARGGVILYRPGDRPREVSLPDARSILVSYSGLNRSTRGQIGRVARV